MRPAGAARIAGLACAAGLLACRGSSESPPPGEPVVEAWAPRVADTLPASVPVGDYVGAAACAPCHAEAYAAWQASPHGRAMAEASPASVLGAFDGREVGVDGGVVVPGRDGDAYVVDIRVGAAAQRHRVDLVLASGRQQQVYVSRDEHGAHRILPIFWSTTTQSWLPTSLYAPADLDPASPGSWQHTDLDQLNCIGCHLSQRHRTVDAAGAAIRWIDLSINCEACHGPGRAHVAHRQPGPQRAGAEPYRDLHALDQHAEARVCGQCHGGRDEMLPPPAPDGTPAPPLKTLSHTHLRPDATQRYTAYQAPGHLVSECFRAGALTCSACHAPHDATPRSLVGDPADGAASDRQCTVCHRDRIAAAAARRHSRHGAGVRCVDCHMSLSWIGDTPDRHQRTSDHSISIPRPQESIDVGTPNACTTCHADRDAAWALAAVGRWGATRAQGTRPWVAAVAAARDGQPAAAAELRAILADARSGWYLLASALDLMAALPADASLAPALEPFSAAADAQLRAYAIRALERHDADRAEHWRTLGAGDPHPYVRSAAFSLADPGAASEAELRRRAEDALAHDEHPGTSLLDVAAGFAERGQLDTAVALAELGLRVSTAAERRGLDLDRRAAVLRARHAAHRTRAGR